MNSLIVSLIFNLSLAITFASASPFSSNLLKKAEQECNVTNPVHQDPISTLTLFTISGDQINFTQEEKCYLHCFIQKIGIFDKNSDLRGEALIEFGISQFPSIANYSHVYIAQVFQVARMNEKIRDKCEKAFQTVKQFARNSMILGIASGLQEKTGVREKFFKAIESGQQVDQKLSKQIKEYLMEFKTLASWLHELAFKLQSQESNIQSQASSALQSQAKPTL